MPTAIRLNSIDLTIFAVYMLLAVASRANDDSPALAQFLSVVTETAVTGGL